jgi:starvation-inducible DNA-binding protein
MRRKSKEVKFMNSFSFSGQTACNWENSFPLTFQEACLTWDRRSTVQALFATIATDLDADGELMAERLVMLGGVALGTARTAAAQSTLPEYPGDNAAGNAHALALAERFAHYTTAMRSAIAHAADVGDANTAAIYTDISGGVDQRLQFLEVHLHQ